MGIESESYITIRKTLAKFAIGTPCSVGVESESYIMIRKRLAKFAIGTHVAWVLNPKVTLRLERHWQSLQ